MSNNQLNIACNFRSRILTLLADCLNKKVCFIFLSTKQDKHILHIADNSSAFVFLDEKIIEHSSGSRAKHYLDAWQHRFQYCSGAFAQTDYNFENANLSLLTESPTSIKLNIIVR